MIRAIFSSYFLRAIAIGVIPITLSTLRAQVPVTQFLPHISIDSIVVAYPDNGLYLISSGQYYRYDLDKLKKAKAPENPSVKQPTFYFPEMEVIAAAPYQSGYLLSIDRDLYYYDGNALRKWSIPLPNSGSITHLTVYGSGFYLLSAGELFHWNQDLYGFQKIKPYQNITTISQSIDPWGYLWASDGEILYRIGQGNHKLPSISIDTIVPPKKENAYRAAITLSAYHPSVNALQVSYQTSNAPDKWIAVDPDNPISISMQDINSLDFSARASIDNKYYQYTTPAKIHSIKNTTSHLWWLLLLPLSILVAAWIIYKRELTFKKRILEIKQKNKMLQDLKSWQAQAQQLQMNPHFIFNALNSITSLIILNENQKARHYLQKFSTMMRSVLSQSNQKRIPLEEEIQYLDNYLSLERFTRGEKFDYRINNQVTGEVSIPPMLIQPLLENAIIHGFSAIEGKGEIVLTFIEEEKYLLVTVRDNGVGFDGNSTHTQNSPHQSVALDLIKKRLQRVSKFSGGSITFEKIENQKSPASGTIVTLKIPY